MKKTKLINLNKYNLKFIFGVFLFSFALILFRQFDAFSANNQFVGDSVYKMSTPGCNNTSFVQVPTAEGDTFIGRELFDNGGCVQKNAKVVEYNFDWKKKVFKKNKELVLPGDQIFGGYTVLAAYDADIAFYKNEYWVSFECTLGGMPTVSACIGPWTKENGIDLARTTVVVKGANYNNGVDLYSASVPKLLVHKNHLYLYWTAVRMATVGRVWKDISTRGMEVEVALDDRGAAMIFPLGMRAPVIAMDPFRNVEVIGLGSELDSNTVADAFAFYSDGKNVYATAGVGGSDCLLNPSGINFNAKVSGCYRLAIFASSDPLEFRGFNQNILKNTILPGNGQEYARRIYSPERKPHFITYNFPSTNPADTGLLLPNGLVMFDAKDLPELYAKIQVPAFSRSCDLSAMNGAARNTESKVHFVYCLLLGRSADSAGLANWSKMLQSGMSPLEFAERVFSSREFMIKNRVASLGNEDYLKLLYQSLLHRDPSQKEIQSYLDKLSSGKVKKNQLLTAFIRSLEFKNVNRVLF